MKTSLAISVLLFSGFVSAEIWEKPPYRPDENHRPPEVIVPVEAQEESPEEIKEGKHQDVRKPESSPDFELIDDEMNEGEEASQ